MLLHPDRPGGAPASSLVGALYRAEEGGGLAFTCCEDPTDDTLPLLRGRRH